MGENPRFSSFSPTVHPGPVCRLPALGQALRVSHVSVVYSRSKILQLRTKVRLLKEENWRGPSCLDRSLHYPALRSS